jgi:hypothetical protein
MDDIENSELEIMQLNNMHRQSVEQQMPVDYGRRSRMLANEMKLRINRL